MSAEPSLVVPPGFYVRGTVTDAGFFPIAVWLQDPAHAAKYKDLGINVYVGLWRGPTEKQLAVLKKHGLDLGTPSPY